MSSTEQASVAVIGMGTVGAMAAWQLSKLVPGRIIGIEQYGVAHAYGAYAGESRLFRTAAYEGEHYTPLLVRAQQLWRELERESGQSIYLQVGALTIAPGASPKIAGTLEAAERFVLPHEHLVGRELRRRFPQHDFDDGDEAILDLARRAGAVHDARGRRRGSAAEDTDTDHRRRLLARGDGVQQALQADAVAIHQGRTRNLRTARSRRLPGIFESKERTRERVS